jgi:hypothetical protein
VRRELTPENDAKMRAHRYKMVKRRLAELGRGDVPPGAAKKKNGAG